MPGRWRRTHHTRPGRPGLYARTHARSASPHSSMRYPVEARTQTGPTLPAVDTAFGLIAYARADRADTGCLAHPVGQEAEVAQPMEAVRRDMQHQTPQEVYGLEREGTQAVATRVVLVAEGHLAALQGHEPVVRDGDTMRIAGQVGEDVLGILE